MEWPCNNISCKLVVHMLTTPKVGGCVVGSLVVNLDSMQQLLNKTIYIWSCHAYDDLPFIKY